MIIEIRVTKSVATRDLSKFSELYKAENPGKLDPTDDELRTFAWEWFAGEAIRVVDDLVDDWVEIIDEQVESCREEKQLAVEPQPLEDDRLVHE